jgi:AcrR family transcriptional regulator
VRDGAGVTTTAPRRARRTQAERTAHTRTALLDATLASLVDSGFARTTTTEVARRAGVSLGALSHHFPAKTDLLVAAVGHLLDRRLAEFRISLGEVPGGTDRVDAALDLLWGAFSGPTFVAWVELWVAARTDPELSRAVLAMADGFRSRCRSVLGELLAPGSGPPPAALEQAMDFAFAVMEGAALRGLVRPPDDTPVRILKQVVASLDLPVSS